MSGEKDSKKQSTALVMAGRAIKKRQAKKALAKKHVAKHHPAKQAAKKHHDEAKKGHNESRKGAKDLRRAYEHLARVRVLLAARDADAKLKAAAAQLASLVTEDLRGSHAAPKLAAELARAAEHIAYAGLVKHDAFALPWSDAIETALSDEYDKLSGEAEPGKKAKHGRERGAAVRTLHASMKRAAQVARGEGNYAVAMECLRAAEALASALEHRE